MFPQQTLIKSMKSDLSKMEERFRFTARETASLRVTASATRANVAKILQVRPKIRFPLTSLHIVRHNHRRAPSSN